MKQVYSSIIYENPLPQLRSRQAAFPWLCEASDGTVIASFSIGEAFESVFTDVGENDDYFNDIMTASGLGIINGYNGSFNPMGNTTRAETASILNNVLSVLK